MKRRYEPVVYVVTWDNAEVVKIGYSAYRRWQPFPGMRLVLALPFRDGIDALALESEAHQIAYRSWPRAFTTAIDATPYLGRDGGGYLECYRTAPGNALDLMASLCASRCTVTMPRRIVTPQCGVAL